MALFFHSFLFRKIVNWLCLHVCLKWDWKGIRIAKGCLSFHPSNGDDAWWISGSQKCGFLFRTQTTLKSIIFTEATNFLIKVATTKICKHLCEVHLMYVWVSSRQFLENFSFSLSSISPPPTVGNGTWDSRVWICWLLSCPEQ